MSPSCSFTVDNVGRLEHLHAEDTTLVTRAPFAKLERFRARMGWTIPWYSSAGSASNHRISHLAHALMAATMWPTG